jgi:hypothetical protein
VNFADNSNPGLVEGSAVLVQCFFCPSCGHGRFELYNKNPAA